MKMFKVAVAVFVASAFLFSCGDKKTEKTVETSTEDSQVEEVKEEGNNTANTIEETVNTVDTSPKLQSILGTWKEGSDFEMTITKDNKIVLNAKGDKTEAQFEVFDKCEKDGGVATATGNFITFKKGNVDCCYEILFEGGGDLEMRLYEGSEGREAMFTKVK